MVTVSSSVVDRSTVASAVLLCAANQSVDNDSDTATLCRADRLRWIDDTSRLAQLVKDVVLGLVLVAACLLTIVGNALVLHAVRTERKLQTVSQRHYDNCYHSVTSDTRNDTERLD